VPPAQSQEPPRRDSAGEAGGHHRFKRLREILARFRHALCGRATPLRREPFRLCAAVPRSNGKADVDFIEGLSPAIAIEQRSAGGKPTVDNRNYAEIYDYLRVLFSAVGQPHDPLTGRPLSRQTPQQIVDQVLAFEPGTKIVVLAPLIENQPGEFRDVFEKLRREGFVRARIDGQMIELDRTEPIRLRR